MGSSQMNKTNNLKEREYIVEKILYVTDLDGTLLRKNGKIHAESLAIINELVEKGLLFTYATARSLSSAWMVTQGLKVSLPVIVHNGAFIMNADTGDMVVKQQFHIEEMEEAKRIFQDCGISPLVYSFIQGEQRVSWLPQKENEGIRHYLNERKGDKRFRPVVNEDELYQGDMFYFTCIGEKEELQPVYEQFSKDKRYRCTLQQELYRPEFWCEIMPVGATKANAIKLLKERYHCDKIIAFGDAINDIPMFETADEAYAVENGVEELKKLATGLIDSNEENGVAKWLKKYAVLG